VPKRVKEAVEEYRRDANPLADFLDDECVISKGRCVPFHELWSAYHRWTDETRPDARVKSKTAFGLALRGLGFEKTLRDNG
jgi:phage/plasmid-associated DNA primase